LPHHAVFISGATKEVFDTVVDLETHLVAEAVISQPESGGEKSLNGDPQYSSAVAGGQSPKSERKGMPEVVLHAGNPANLDGWRFAG